MLCAGVVNDMVITIYNRSTRKIVMETHYLRITQHALSLIIPWILLPVQCAALFSQAIIATNSTHQSLRRKVIFTTYLERRGR